MTVRNARSSLLALVFSATLLTGLLPAGHPAVALATAPSGAPASLSPSTGDTIDGNPTFAWGAVAGATKYRVQVSTAADFTVNTFSVDTAERRATPTADLPRGLLYWRVAGMDAASNLGPWASTDFTRQWGAPVPDYPNDGDTLVFPTTPLRFSWTPLRGAQSYQLEVDDAADFVGATTYSTKNTSFVITEPRTYGQPFFWHVRGVSATNGIVSSWSGTRSNTLSWPGTPTLVYPADSAVIAIESVGDLYFDWSAVLGAKTYQLQVSPNADWTNNRTIDVPVKGTRYAPPVTLNNGNYYWRVRALDAAGTPNLGPWSAVRVFQRGWGSRPVLQAPSDGNIAVGVPTFTWTPVSHAAWYWIQVSTDVNFGSGSDCFTNRTTWTPYGAHAGIALSEPGNCGVNLVPGVTYYWHVRGVDGPVLNAGIEYGAGVLGLWSNTSNLDVHSFIYQPAMPTLASPADGATVEVPTLSWSDSPGATRYHVVIVRISTGAIAASGDTYSTSWTPTGSLPIGVAYRWYVQPYDTNGHLSLIPSVVSQPTFTLVAISTLYPAPEQVAPADASSGYVMPSLSWQPVTGATAYRVFYGVQGSGVESDLSGSVAYPAFTYATAVLSPGTYFWYVRAYNGATEIASSSATWTFVIGQLDLLDPAGYLTPDKCDSLPSCTAVEDTATLSWAPVQGALGYHVIVALDPNFTNIYRTYDTNFTRLSPRDSWRDNQANQAYYWFVRPFRSNNSGRFDSLAQQNASAYLKRSEPIHLLAPVDNATVKDEITFSWSDFLTANQALTVPVTQEAKQYRIQVSTVADFATTIDDKTVDETFFTAFDKTYPEGPLYWRVSAIDGSGNDLTWSLPADIPNNRPNLVNKTSDPVTLSTPVADPSQGSYLTGIPAFTWVPQAYAASYEIEIARNGDTNFASENQVTRTGTKMAAFAYTDALAKGDYAWRVRRKDADDRSGPWSAGRVFHLNPAAPSLIAPADAATLGLGDIGTLLFQWSSSQEYPKYLLETSTSSTFASTVESKSTVMTSWAPTTLYGTGTYYWRVKALNSNSSVVATSGPRTFTVDSSVPTVIALSPSTSAPITTSFTATFSRPVLGISASTFKVEIAGTTTAVAGTLTPSPSTSTTAATFKPSAPLVPGQSYKISFTAGITDLAATPLVPKSWTVRTALVVENGSVAFKETWPRIANASASGGAYAAARQAGATQSFTFSGTSASILAMTGPAGGNADVYVDGVKVTATPVSFYSSSTKWKVAVWSATGLAAATHTITLRALGTKTGASTGTWIWLDAFVGDGVTNQETSASVAARFVTVSTASAYGGSYDTIARAYGEKGNPVITLRFKGTGVVIYATRSASSGKIAIYVDGSLKKTLSLYSSSTKYKQAVWTSATLSSASHTLVVKVIGATSTTKSHRNAGIDRFLVK